MYFKSLPQNREFFAPQNSLDGDKWNPLLTKLHRVTSPAPDLITSNLWNTFWVWSVLHTSVKKKKKDTSGCSFTQAETDFLLGSSQGLSQCSTEDSEETWPRGRRLYFLHDWCRHKATWAVALQSFLALVWSAPLKLLDPLACETWSCAEIYFEMKANTGRSAWSLDKVWGLRGALFIM